MREPRPPHRKAYFLHELTVLDVDEVAAFTADRYDARLLRNAPVGTEVLRVTAVDPDNSSTPYGQVRYGIAGTRFVCNLKYISELLLSNPLELRSILPVHFSSYRKSNIFLKAVTVSIRKTYSNKSFKTTVILSL